MVAAAATIWLTFSLYIGGPIIGLPHSAVRASVTLLVTELLLLMVYGYGTEGCDAPHCAPVAQACGVAARVDVPLLTAVFVIVVVVRSTLGRWTATAQRSSRSPGGAASGR